MTKKTYIGWVAIYALVCCAIGGYAFAQWMDSTAAGFFAFIALDAVYDLGIAIRIASKCDHVTEDA